MTAEFKRLFRFGVTGCLNTAVDFGVFFLFLKLLHFGPTPSQAVGYLCGVANSWIFNSLWVFPGDSPGRSRLPALPRFIAATGAVTAATVIAMDLLSAYTLLPVWADKILVTLLGMGVNYLLYRFWVFRDKNEKSAAE